jgi:hypothetical protein
VSILGHETPFARCRAREQMSRECQGAAMTTDTARLSRGPLAIRSMHENPLDERAFGQAADGTRTHDLLHGNQKLSFRKLQQSPANDRFLRDAPKSNARRLPAIHGDLANQWQTVCDRLRPDGRGRAIEARGGKRGARASSGKWPASSKISTRLPAMPRCRGHPPAHPGRCTDTGDSMNVPALILPP